MADTDSNTSTHERHCLPSRSKRDLALMRCLALMAISATTSEVMQLRGKFVCKRL